MKHTAWRRWLAMLVAVVFALVSALPVLAASRSFSSGAGIRSSGFSSRPSSSRSFSTPTRPSGSFSSPSRSTPAPKPSTSRPSTSSGSFSSPSTRPATSPSSSTSPSRSFSSPSTGSFSTLSTNSYSSSGDSYSSSGTRSFTSPFATKTTLPPNTTGTTTINNQTYTYNTDRWGRPVIDYDLGRTVYRTYPPVVVYGAPPFDPWYYHDYYWGRPWYWRMWYRPTYSYYGPSDYGYGYSWLTWLAAIGGSGAAMYLFYAYQRRRRELDV